MPPRVVDHSTFSDALERVEEPDILAIEQVMALEEDDGGARGALQPIPMNPIDDDELYVIYHGPVVPPPPPVLADDDEIVVLYEGPATEDNREVVHHPVMFGAGNYPIDNPALNQFEIAVLSDAPYDELAFAMWQTWPNELIAHFSSLTEDVFAANLHQQAFSTHVRAGCAYLAMLALEELGPEFDEQQHCNDSFTIAVFEFATVCLVQQCLHLVTIPLFAILNRIKLPHSVWVFLILSFVHPNVAYAYIILVYSKGCKSAGRTTILVFSRASSMYCPFIIGWTAFAGSLQAPSY